MDFCIDLLNTIDIMRFVVGNSAHAKQTNEQTYNNISIYIIYLTLNSKPIEYISWICRDIFDDNILRYFDFVTKII